jgi:hypothetical protein
MTTSPEPTPEDVPGNRYRCNCGWSHTVREDAEGCREDTDVILLHIRSEHPQIAAAARAEAAPETVSDQEAGRRLGAAVDLARDSERERVIRYRAERFKAFQARADQERDFLKDHVVVAVRDEGMSELQASKLAGVTRQTVRAWLGK